MAACTAAFELRLSGIDTISSGLGRYRNAATGPEKYTAFTPT
jgi:hypothetical protein